MVVTSPSEELSAHGALGHTEMGGDVGHDSVEGPQPQFAVRGHGHAVLTGIGDPRGCHVTTLRAREAIAALGLKSLGEIPR